MPRLGRPSVKQHLAGIALALNLAPGAAAEYFVDAQAPHADDANPGTADKPFRHIAAAAALAGPGDAVTVRAGVYRERVSPARGGTKEAPVVYRAAPGEAVVLKGSDVFEPEWRPLGGRQYAGRLDPALFREAVNPFHRTISVSGKDTSKAARPVDPAGPMEETLGQVFVNGAPYIQVTSPESLARTPGAWLVDATGEELWVHFRPDADPTAGTTGATGIKSPLVEISTRSRVFAPYRRGLAHVHVLGFVMEHCANQGPFPQGGALSVRSGRDWLIEGNTVRFAKTVGIDIGSEYWDGEQLARALPTAEEDQRLMIGGGHRVVGNTVADNGLCGIAGWNSRDVRIVENVVERNNRLGFPRGRGWEEWAGIKLHASNAFIAGNLIRDNDAAGIWIDNDYNGARITRNVIVNNQHSGIFLELGAGSVLVDTNVVAYTRPSHGVFYPGSGLYAHDAAGVTAAHNLFFANAGFGVEMRVITDRKFANRPVEASGERIVNNIVAQNALGCVSLPAASPRSRDNHLAGNVYQPGPGGAVRGPFRINQFQAGFRWADLAGALEKAAAEGLLESRYAVAAEALKADPSLGFAAWRAITGQDANSAMFTDQDAGLYLDVRGRVPELKIKAGAAFLARQAPPPPGVDRDFAGNAMLADNAVLPGPFQNLPEDAVPLPLVPWTAAVADGGVAP